MERGNALLGKPDGLQVFWHENGQKMRESLFEQGIEVNQKGWYSNGQIAADVIFKSGKINSGSKWKPNGEICPISSIKNGNGVWVHYNDDGSEKEMHEFIKGVRVTDIPEPILEEPYEPVFPK